MPALLDLGWKSALVAGLVLLAGLLLRRRPAAERVTLLRAGMMALLLLPVFALAGPRFEIPVFPASEQAPLRADVAATAGAMADPAAMPFLSSDWAVSLYLLGAAALLSHLLLGCFMLRRWSARGAEIDAPGWHAAVARAAARTGLRRHVRLRLSRNVAAPISWGITPAWVLLDPETASCDDRAEAVIAHELAHIRRLDWPMLLVSRLAVAMFWFNPLVWLVARSLARDAELAADDDALRYVPRADYAQALLHLAGSAPHRIACGMSAPRSGLSRRIHAILVVRAARPANRLACAAMLACVPLALPLATVQLARAPASFRTLQATDDRPAAPARLAQMSVATTARHIPSPAPSHSSARSRGDVKPAPTMPNVLRDIGAAGAPVPRRTASMAAADAWEPAPPYREPVALHEHEPRQPRMALAADSAGGADRLPPDLLAGAARQMRLEARKLEKEAADPMANPKTRRANPILAGSMRQEADRLEAIARRVGNGLGT